VRGASPCLPRMSKKRCRCSCLVGMPVEGPPRCVSTTTSGVSVIPARPRFSCISEMPGPALAVIARADAGISYEDNEQACAGYCYGDSTYGQRALYGLGLTGILAELNTGGLIPHERADRSMKAQRMAHGDHRVAG